MELLEDFFKNTNYNKFYKSVDCNNNNCAICNTPYDENNKVTLDCKHCYHQNCINDLLKSSHYFTCPYCKSYQAQFKIKKTCKYITKTLKTCNKECISDLGICSFHHKYMKTQTKCMAICQSGKRCTHKKITNSLYCKKHYHLS